MENMDVVCEKNEGSPIEDPDVNESDFVAAVKDSVEPLVSYSGVAEGDVSVEHDADADAVSDNNDLGVDALCSEIAAGESAEVDENIGGLHDLDDRVNVTGDENFSVEGEVSDEGGSVVGLDPDPFYEPTPVLDCSSEEEDRGFLESIEFEFQVDDDRDDFSDVGLDVSDDEAAARHLFEFKYGCRKRRRS